MAAAIGIPDDNSAHYELTDNYGVTYIGAASHLALMALMRADLSRALDASRTVRAQKIRGLARILLDWFTSPWTPGVHAVEFTWLSARQVCELVVYLLRQPEASVLTRVGSETVRLFTNHLLHDAVPDPERPLPPIADLRRRPLFCDDGSGIADRLKVTAVAPGGNDTVRVNMNIKASETLNWTFTTGIEVSLDELIDMLVDPDNRVDDVLEGSRAQFEAYLDYDLADVTDIDFSGELGQPGAILDAAPSDTVAVAVELFFVGTDRATALSTKSFSSRALAEAAAGTGDQIFRTRIAVGADKVYPIPRLASAATPPGNDSA
jgi:hypothetical protein